MTAELRDADDEVKQLRRCINDLIGLVTLPVIWSGGAPPAIASEPPHRADCHLGFGRYTAHQPFGLILPSTILHASGGSHCRQLSHC
jgi:hypothetical protein